MVEVVAISAGPYGLSTAPHLRGLQIPFRIFGKPMTLWRNNMPKGMLLKSNGLASNLAAPDNFFPLARSYKKSGRWDYSDIGMRITVETLVEYGFEFQRRHVGGTDEAQVARPVRTAAGFEVVLDTGEQVSTRKVVVGPLAFRRVPEALASLPWPPVSHSSDNHDLSRRKGRVAIIGGGQSALETAALLHEQGTEVTLLARRPLLWFDPPNEDAPQSDRPLLARVRRPNFGLSPGWRTWFWSEAPHAFRHLPASTRMVKASSTFGPAGAGWLKHRVDGLLSIKIGTLVSARERSGKAVLTILGLDGPTSITADHIIAATGYKADLRRLDLLSELIDNIGQVGHTPGLDKGFGSSVSGLHFIGDATAPSSRPSMRFIYGTRFAATQVARRISHLGTRRGQTRAITNQQAA